MKWNDILQEERKKEYYKTLIEKITNEEQEHNVFPTRVNRLNAFKMTEFEDVKVVIIGQDPYHSIGQAHGLCFSTPSIIKNPPSMKNILKEIEAEYGKPSQCEDGNLEPWARQGVLLLNASLTVNEGQANSHKDFGWRTLIIKALQTLNEKRDGIIYILWGKFAQNVAKEAGINSEKNLILKSGHPSPLSFRHFTGNNHFLDTNKYLKENGKTEIEW